ncbi:MAG: AAA family ATPase [Actinobacteria bacterium]|nr:AAA family ATPase [Actinomycetota bacterium]
MLLELAVEGLGVIDATRLVLGPGMTALTGETGAGKTMLVEAIELLVGGRAEPHLVRPGAPEATVEGRFELGGDETVLTRVVPRDGRSRAYVDGRMATAAALAVHGRRLVDLHGQHDHQSLLSAAVQREALDRFGGIDLEPLHEARRRLAAIERRLAELGGDAGARAREADLLRFQAGELAAAGLADPDEDRLLSEREDALADAAAHREAAQAAAEALLADGGARDLVAAAMAALAGRAPFAPEEARLHGLAAEVDDVAATVRDKGEAIEEDPESLAAVRARRQLLHDLVRKYGTASVDGDAAAAAEIGTGTLAAVLAYADAVGKRLEALERHDELAGALERDRTEARARVAAEAAAVARARRACAPRLGEAVEAHLVELAMARAKVAVEVGGEDPGDAVRFLLAANPGTPALPLAKVASGGELARAMLALRLVLTASPPTLVFDEVDAGVGGAAAVAVGRALAALATDHQILVVTHLPQVAAFADAHVAVTKLQQPGATSAAATLLDDDGRLVELSRMLSGRPGSTIAHDHAAELLATAAGERGRGRRREPGRTAGAR